jgi:hypothetical protein
VSPSWFHRLPALLLIGIFLSGGGGMPVLDAVSHGAGRDAAAGPHFETSTDAQSHRDFCSLGARLSLSPQIELSELGLACGVVAFADPALRAGQLRSADLGLLPQPRAPPANPE